MLERAFTFIQKWEGGSLFTDDPRDPGGPTKWGVALNYCKDDIPDKNKDGRIDKADVKLLTEEDARAIFKKRYWDPCHCGDLPPAICLSYADICYNMGQGVGPRMLQRALNKLGFGLVVDGKIGPKTMAAVKKASQKRVVEALYELRMERYQTRSGWKFYGKGWTNRAKDCLKESLNLV